MGYCIKCGNLLADGANFCTRCGAPVAVSKAAAPKQAASASSEIQTAKTQKRKAVELPKKDVDAFNSAVSKVKSAADTAKAVVPGKKPETDPAKTAARGKQLAAAKPVTEKMSRPEKAAGKAGARASGAVGFAAPGIGSAAVSAESFAVQASQAGEFALGDFDVAGKLLSSVGGQAEEIISPIKAIFGTIGSFFKGLFSLFGKPKNLIIAIIMIVLWVVLGILQGNPSEPVKILSWLTFAQGGLDRNGITGLVGGILGKGTVAAALGSLFTGGIPNFFKGIGSALKGTGEKRSIVSLVIGAVLGTVLYFAFTGPELASKATAMAGIAGAVLSLESIGRKEGPLYSLAQSLTSKVQDGVRTVQSGKAQSLLSGLFLGFAAATALMAFVG